jgi:hypothetical protein
MFEPVSKPNSLLSGNLTGNSAKFGGFGQIQAEISASCQMLVSEFPKKANREFFQTNREFWFMNREEPALRFSRS